MANNILYLFTDKAIGAMLGAACGDALGWPNERIRRSNSKKQQQSLLHEFKQWPRRAGGRFYPHEEIIEAGEYSDDTQLILCMSRSLQQGARWWHHWTQIELPFWPLYERGGGGATKRAAAAWQVGNSPWAASRNPREIKKYFDAGGNGVAMRVLPHVLHLSNSQTFMPLAKNIMLDGITTHGHPRALVGALAYGYALWKSLRQESVLEYGEIADSLITNIKEWSKLPDISLQHGAWLQSADHFLLDYHKIWEATIGEMESSLSICKNELEKGELAIDEEALRNLHCFDRKINGAGTITAVAAVYLASRYAPDPIHGLVRAAFSIGADTDTIASMAGGLLGTINGSTWLLPIKNKVQDSKYLVKIAQILISKGKRNLQSKTILEIKHTSLKKWAEELTLQPEGTDIFLPDGRKGILYSTPDQLGRGKRYKVQFRKVVCMDGQHLYFKKISKGVFQPNSAKGRMPLADEGEAELMQKLLRFGAKIPVQSIEKAIWFYQDLLGLRIKRQDQDIVVFEQGLVIVPKTYITEQWGDNQFRTLLYLEVTDIKQKFLQINDKGFKIITPIGRWSKSNLLFFRCADLDGNVVEVFSSVR